MTGLRREVPQRDWTREKREAVVEGLLYAFIGLGVDLGMLVIFIDAWVRR